MIKPKRLKPGDTVAIVSPSSGLPSIFPHIYENGLKVLRKWGLSIKEFPAARMDDTFLRANPQIRAKDINNAFADKTVKGIFASIGGDDSVRVLPYLNKKIIVNNPKILMGYSDTTTLHVFANIQGLSTFYGPSIMAGFAQMECLAGSFENHVKEILFEPKKSYAYKPYSDYCDGYPDWANKHNVGRTNPVQPNDGWHWLQGSGKVQGQLFGGCMEVLEMIKATPFWPSPNYWGGKIFFLETSEEKPSLHYIDHVLRNYGALGVFDKIHGLIFGRARDYTKDEKKKLEEKIVAVIAKEFGRGDLPIVANFDVGHTDPQLILPLGVNAEIDCRNNTISLIESWLK